MSTEFHFDRAHSGKPIHLDLIDKFSDGSGASKVEVDGAGNIIEQSISMKGFGGKFISHSMGGMGPLAPPPPPAG